jgi:8-oxo-dGTP diphosphatase
MDTRFDDIDWSTWKPQERATLLFLRRDGQILLIRKKRGLGAGKINGPGGRIDADESPHECAIREVQEELRVTPTGVLACGELSFQFVDGYALFVYVFTATGCAGEPQETDEAAPMWTPLDQIPFHEMWADDHIWFPSMLGGRSFDGRFLFDGDALLGYEVIIAGGSVRLTSGTNPCPSRP